MNSQDLDITDDLPPDLGSVILPEEATVLLEALREEIEALFGLGEDHKLA